MLVYITAFVVAIYLFMKWKNRKAQDYELLSIYFQDKNWSNDDEGRSEFEQSIYAFNIEITKDKVIDLNKRLDLSRFPVPSISTSKFRYGIRDDYMQKIVNYWRSEYSWKNEEAVINSYSHFKTNIEGLNIHFIHTKPKDLASGIEPRVILVLHGWPGSFVEYLEAIDMLTDPKKHGGNETDAFTVICPSIPGFGFSDAPQKEGFHVYECARVFHKLMLRLGYKKYYVAGGDWGSIISTAMAKMYPSYIKGCYTTMATGIPMGINLFKTMISSYAPSLFYNPMECKLLFPLKKLFLYFIEESGYLHIQGTKPDTLGFALSDSPVGMAAYIIEKFSTWTNSMGRDSDDGLLSKYWTNNQLLNNVMIYWWSGNITSSLRFYKENMGNKHIQQLDKIKVTVPSGFGWYPDEFIPTCKDWVKQKFSNLIHFTYMDSGGHFNAYQVPAKFTDDLRLFVRRVEKLEREQTMEEIAAGNTVKSSHLDRYEK